MWANKEKILKLMPAILVLVTLFLGGIYNGFIQSIKLTSDSGVSLFTLSNYCELLSSREFYEAFYLTLKIAVISTSIAAVFALILAYCLFHLNSIGDGEKCLRFQNKLKLPMLLPYLAAAYIIYIMFSGSGYISRIFYSLGIIESIEQFPQIVNDKSGIGIMITYIWKTTPFILLMIFPLILKSDRRWLDAAAVLGMRKTRFFWTVTFKLIKPTLFISMYIVFAYTFASFETAYMLGVTNPKTLSVYSYLMYTNGNIEEKGMALAINFVIVVFIVIVGIILLKYLNKRGTYEKK